MQPLAIESFAQAQCLSNWTKGIKKTIFRETIFENQLQKLTGH